MQPDSREAFGDDELSGIGMLLKAHPNCYHSHMRHGICNVLSCICLCVVCNAVTFESLDLISSVLICKYSFRISRANSYIKVTGVDVKLTRAKREYPVLLYQAESSLVILVIKQL